MDADRIARVRYFDGQYLRPQDFTDEQGYHVAMRRRHNLAGHSWGIVSGLAVKSAGAVSAIEPGLAVDGYGREIVVPRRLPVPRLPAPPPGAPPAYDVWICYDRVGSDQPPDGYAACGASGTAYYRWQEQPRVLVTEADSDPDPTSPPGVPDGDLDFGPERTAPEENRPWPVFLARLTPAEIAGQYLVDGTARRYAGVVAASVVHPAGVARVDLAPAPETVFSVRDGSDTDRFTIGGDGLLTAPGGLRVDGELRIDTGALNLPPSASDGKEPWQIRAVEEDGVRELQVVIAPGGDASFSIGKSASDGRFEPALTVTGDDRVVVHGALHVAGKLTAREIATQRSDPATQALITGTMLSGIAGAAGVAAKLYQPPAAAVALADVLAADPALLREVAAKLRADHAEVADGLIQQLSTLEGPA
ncbi:hypothetical protein [Amycolatopsis sp. NPDC021455]|uniref:hypothetical protein n=1 Tax=Amycolatopsis sp. NPDC021455 TaxID=3154901 RepID=UPI0033E4E12E